MHLYIGGLDDWTLSRSASVLETPVPLPKDVFLDKDSRGISPYVLRGWLASRTDQHRKIKVRIQDFDRWAVDRSSGLRGLWIGSKLAWYWLRQPALEKKQWKVRVESKFLQSPDKPELYAQQPNSQEDQHLEMRAKMDLFSNLCDVLLFDETDTQTMVRHSNKKPQHVWRDLMPDAELAEQYPQYPQEPFDYELLKDSAGFILEHIRGFDMKRLPDDSPFMRGLEKLRRPTGRKWSNQELLRSAQEAERRSGRFPWGEPRSGVERINPNWTLEVLIQRAYQKVQQQNQASYRQLKRGDDVTPRKTAKKSNAATRTSGTTERQPPAVAPRATVAPAIQKPKLDREAPPPQRKQQQQPQQRKQREEEEEADQSVTVDAPVDKDNGETALEDSEEEDAEEDDNDEDYDYDDDDDHQEDNDGDYVEGASNNGKRRKRSTQPPNRIRKKPEAASKKPETTTTTMSALVDSDEEEELGASSRARRNQGRKRLRHFEDEEDDDDNDNDDEYDNYSSKRKDNKSGSKAPPKQKPRRIPTKSETASADAAKNAPVGLFEDSDDDESPLLYSEARMKTALVSSSSLHLKTPESI